MQLVIGIARSGKCTIYLAFTCLNQMSNLDITCQSEELKSMGKFGSYTLPRKTISLN